VVQPGASVVAAADKMRAANVGSLPVGEGDRLLGMITDRDIVLRCVAAGINCHKRTVREATALTVSEPDHVDATLAALA